MLQRTVIRFSVDMKTAEFSHGTCTLAPAKHQASDSETKNKNIEAWHNKTKGKHESRNERKQRPLQKIASKDRFAEGILGFHSCPALQMHARL